MIGGLAVFLHGYERTTADINLYTTDSVGSAADLEAAGATWSARKRELRLDGVPIRLVGPEMTGGPVGRTSVLRGVRVASLADMLRMNLLSGLSAVSRAKDLADVVELIRLVPLDKSFAAKLPTGLRGSLKQLVDAVRENR